MVFVDQEMWNLTLNHDSVTSNLANGATALARAHALETGHLSAGLAGGRAYLAVWFNKARATVYYAKDAAGPYYRAFLPNRPSPEAGFEVFPCEVCSLKPAPASPREKTLSRRDAFSLLRQFIALGGELPNSVPEDPDEPRQLALPCMEGLVTADEDWRTVAWTDDY
jgi:hypothetical protein